jgi:hypothetical protein
MRTNEEKTSSCPVKSEPTKPGESAACSICGKPATELVDGEPSCKDHIEQVYEHQMEDFTRARLQKQRVAQGLIG